MFRYAGAAHPNFKDVLKMVARKDGYPVDKATYNAIMNGAVEAKTVTVQGASRRTVALADTFADARDAILEAKLPWEPVVSRFGSTKEVWEFLIENGLVGYMAMLRNLRNFEQANISDDHWKMVRHVLVDGAGNARQLPFRYVSAYFSVSGKKARTIVAEALEAVVRTGHGFDGSTAVLVDVSVSMDTSVSRDSVITIRAAAATLAGIIAKSGDADIICFSDRADEFQYDGLMPVMSIVEKILNWDSGGTYAEKAIEILGKHYDRVIMLSDMQTYGNSVQDALNQYEKKYGKTRYYSVNMAVYEVTPVTDRYEGITLMGGWSEKILDYVKEIENPRAVPVIEEIRKKYRVAA